jgi:hypothetical protein
MRHEQNSGYSVVITVFAIKGYTEFISVSRKSVWTQRLHTVYGEDLKVEFCYIMVITHTVHLSGSQ